MRMILCDPLEEPMEINGIVLSPDPRLLQECAPIEEIDRDIEKLAEKMKKIMFDNQGCGLAAPQIGELVRLSPRLPRIHLPSRKAAFPFPVSTSRSNAPTMLSSRLTISMQT